MKQRIINIIVAGKDRVTGVLGKIGSGLKRFGALALKSFAVAGAGFSALGVGVAALYGRMAGLIDQQAKVASSLGIANEALGAMRDAANMAGISNENLTTGLRRMAQGIQDAANGTGEAKDALERLGLSANQLQSMKPEQAFSAIVAELDKLPNGLEKTALAMDLFGRSGSSMTNLTIAGLRQAQADAETLGLKLTTAQARGVEAANDAWTRIKTVVGDFLKYITAAVAPKINQTFTSIFEYLKSVDLKAWADSAGNALLGMAGVMASAIPKALHLILTGVEHTAKAFSSWRMVWNELEYHFTGFMIVLWTGLHKAREATIGLLQIFEKLRYLHPSTAFLPGTADALAESKRIAQEQVQILGVLEEKRKEALQRQSQELRGREQTTQSVDKYRERVDAVTAELEKMMSAEREVGQVTKQVEQEKTVAINSTTAAVNRQIEAYRRLRAEQGRAPSQGSTQFIPSESSIEKAERTE